MAASLLQKRLERVVEEIDTLVDRGPGRRYPSHVRERVVAVGQALRAEGWSWSDLAGAFGVSDATLKRWFADAPETVDGFCEISVADRTFSLVSPNGWRVDGLTREDLVTLVGM